MKSHFLGCLLALAIAPAAFAQSNVSIGAKAGLSYATLIVDDPANTYSYAPGFHVGGFVRYDLGSVAIQPDVTLSMLTSKVNTGQEELDFNMRYLSIPISFQYQLSESFHVDLGPQIGFLQCAKSEFHPVTRQKFDEQHYTKAYKTTDFGLQTGLGWEAANGFLIDLKYYHGLSEINDFDGVASTKNRWFQMSIGYRLSFN